MSLLEASPEASLPLRLPRRQNLSQDLTTTVARTAPAPAPQPGYVYLSASRGMPGFVQVDTCEEDPSDLTWSLQTMSGVTRFSAVHAIRTSDTAAVVEHFHEATRVNQIPHQSDFFKMPLRFARNILDDAAGTFPAPFLPAPAAKKRNFLPIVAAITAAVTLSVGGFFASRGAAPAHVAQQPAVSHSQSAPAALPTMSPVQTATVAESDDESSAPAIRPHFRFTKM